jgi:hypothetical protein
VADHVILVDPVLHVSAHKIVALPLEQQGGDGAVYSTRKGDKNFFAGGHVVEEQNDEGVARFVK